jgi:hypothetical protein
MGLVILLVMAAMFAVVGAPLFTDWRGISTWLADRSARRREAATGWSRAMRELHWTGIWAWRFIGAGLILVGGGIAVFALLNPPS